MKTLCARMSSFIKLVMVPFCLCLSGCVYLVVGGIGAVGGYIVSPDTVEGIADHDQAAVWDAAHEIISVMGLILEENEVGGTIIAKVNGARVTVSVTNINEHSTKLTVKSRRFGFPRISTAQEVFVKVMSSLRE